MPASKLSYYLQQRGYHCEGISLDNFGRWHGIAKNNQGQKFVIKAVVRERSYAYKSLRAEAHITADLARQKYPLKVPTVAEFISEGDLVCMLTRFVTGKKPTDTKTIGQVLILLSQMSFRSKYLKNYSKFTLLWQLPLRLLQTTLARPVLAHRLIKLGVKSWVEILVNHYEYGLVHPDVTLANIILADKSLYLLDWEEAGWGISEYSRPTSPAIVFFRSLVDKKSIPAVVESLDHGKAPRLGYW